jgi:hypothetical protein
MALALLIAWVALTIFCIKNWDDIQPGFFRRGSFDRGLILAQVALSIGATMLLSLLPLAVSSRATRDWRQHRALHDPGLEHRPTHPVIAVLVCAAAGWAIALCLPAQLIEPLGTDFILRRIGLSDRAAVLVSIGAMLLAYSLSMSYVFRIAHRLRWRRGAIAAGFFLIAFWMSPIIAEVVRNVMNDHNRFVWTRVVGASPIGTLILVFAEGGADPIPGVLVQFLVVLLLATIFYLIARRERVVIEPPSTPSTPSTPEPLPA